MVCKLSQILELLIAEILAHGIFARVRACRAARRTLQPLLEIVPFHPCDFFLLRVCHWPSLHLYMAFNAEIFPFSPIDFLTGSQNSLSESFGDVKVIAGYCCRKNYER